MPPEVLGILAGVRQAARALSYAALVPDAAQQRSAYRLLGEALLDTDVPEGARVLRHALAAAEAIDDEASGADALHAVAQALARAGEPERAMQPLRMAFAAARHAGRVIVFEVLGEAASTLAATDQGRTLWLVYEATFDVDRWWRVA